MEKEGGVDVMSGCVPLAVQPFGTQAESVEASDDTERTGPLLVKYKWLKNELIEEAVFDTVVFATGQ